MREYWVSKDFFKTDELTLAHSETRKNKYYGLLEDESRTYNVYVRELFEILASRKVTCHHSGEFNGCSFKPIYMQGYKEGENHFEQEYKVNPDTMFSNSSAYMKNLHWCYFHKAPNLEHGWINWINTYPIVVHERAIHLYGYVAGIKSQIDLQKEQYPYIFRTFEDCPEKHNMEKTLDSLLENNSEFELRVQEFNSKINTAGKIMSNEQFLKEEIERVDNVYSRMETIINAKNPIIASFDFSIYGKYAFDWLKCGQNFPLKNIMENAKLQFSDAYEHSPETIQQLFKNGQFEKHISEQLTTGVAWLMYWKFLREQLSGSNTQIKTLSKQIDQLTSPLDLIDSINRELLMEYERNLATEISKWKCGRDKTGCSVFMILLKQKGIFINDTFKSAKQFAKGRYGLDCTVMINKLQKSDQKDNLEKKLILMQRKIINKPFGKL